MAILIVGRALLRILEAIIGLGDRLELGLGLGIAGIAIGMVDHRQTAIGRFDRRAVRGALAFEQFVEIDVGHA